MEEKETNILKAGKTNNVVAQKRQPCVRTKAVFFHSILLAAFLNQWNGNLYYLNGYISIKKPPVKKDGSWPYLIDRRG